MAPGGSTVFSSAPKLLERRNTWRLRLMLPGGFPLIHSLSQPVIHSPVWASAASQLLPEHEKGSGEAGEAPPWRPPVTGVSSDEVMHELTPNAPALATR